MPRRKELLSKLAALHEAGILADDEFSAKKAELPARFDGSSRFVGKWIPG